MLRLHVPLKLYTDWKSLYDDILGLYPKNEKHLLIDLYLIRQSKDRGEIAEVIWIPSAENQFDAVTQKYVSAALIYLFDHNLLNIHLES